MITIYKYPLMAQVNEIEMPLATILSVGLDPNNTPCIWATVDINSEKEVRRFALIGTGWPLDDFIEKYHMNFLDTIKEGPYMWHVFELKKKVFLEPKRED